MLTVRDDGNVGIGTTSPSTFGKLAVSVSGTGSKAGIGISNGGHNGTLISPTEIGLLELFSSAGTAPAGIYALNSYNSNNASWLSFKTTNGAGTTSTIMTISSGGNVGIGTTNPNYKLEIKHNNNTGVGIDITNPAAEGYYAILENGVNGGGLEYFGDSWGSSIFQNAVSMTSWKNNVGKIVFLTTTSNSIAARMLITNGGNVGIGTTDPGNDKLQINETSDADLNVGIVARGANSKRAQLTFGVKNSGSTNVGGSIGSSGTRGGGLVLQGNTGSISEGAAHLFISAGGDISAGTFSQTTPSSNRQLYVTSAGVLTTSSSDARLKTNIVVIPNALQKVMGLRGVTYNWKDGRDTTRVLGMIAQEMLKVAPELVFQNNNGYYGIHYAETTGLLVEAIKEQQKVIEQLKAEQTTTSSLLRQLQLDLQAIRKQNAVHKE